MRVETVHELLVNFFKDVIPKLGINPDDFKITPFYENPVAIPIGELNIQKKSDYNLRKERGLYILTSSEDEIIYIGKAEKTSLHDEIWGKLKTPEVLGDKWIFPKSFKSHIDKRKDLKLGKAKLAIYIFSHKELTSLAEVYLQTLFYYKNNKKLPLLNYRIG